MESILKIKDHLSLDIAVSSDEGSKINNLIEVSFATIDMLVLDFEGIKVMTTVFLNSAIGQLYKNHDSAFLNQHLKIQGLDASDLVLLKKVIANAKEYFKNSTAFDRSIDEVLGDE